MMARRRANGGADAESNEEEREGGGSSSSSGSDSSEEEGVLSGVEDGEEESDSSSSGDESDLPMHLRLAVNKRRKGAVEASDEEEDDGSDEEKDATRGWGKSKKAYYDGDTADLEIGQEFEEAEEEEREARRLQKVASEGLLEQDYELSDEAETASSEDEEPIAEASAIGEKLRMAEGGKGRGRRNERRKSGQSNSAMLGDAFGGAGLVSEEQHTTLLKKDASKLSKQQRLQLLLSESPELPELLSGLRDHLETLTTEVDPLANDVTESLGGSVDGLRYLHVRRQLLLASASTACFYLLLKSKGEFIRGHPVVSQLLRLQSLAHELGTVDADVSGQVRLLVNALSEGVNLAAEGGAASAEDPGSASSEEDEGEFEPSSAAKGGEHSDGDASSAYDDEELLEEESRFLGGGSGVGDEGATRGRKRRLAPVGVEFGDGGDDARLPAKRRPAASRSSATFEKENDSEEDLDLDDLLMSGLKRSEPGDNKREDGFTDSGLADFYRSVATAKTKEKKVRKSKYQATTRIAGALEAQAAEELERKLTSGKKEGDASTKRGISQEIMKNRGLTPHKNKLNRNPRVKKREAFRKAVIRRKGQVRDMRVGEAADYGGEATGIRVGVVRSRKLG